MGRSRRRIAALTPSALLIAIVVFDVSRERAWDLLPVLAVALLLQFGVLTASGKTRREVAVRVDLHQWMSQRAAETGEDLDRVADRCVAAYRAGLTSEPAETSREPHGSVPLTVSLPCEEPDVLAVVGGKAAGIDRLLRAGFDVPPTAVLAASEVFVPTRTLP